MTPVSSTPRSAPRVHEGRYFCYSTPLAEDHVGNVDYQMLAAPAALTAEESQRLDQILRQAIRVRPQDVEYRIAPFRAEQFALIRSEPGGNDRAGRPGRVFLQGVLLDATALEDACLPALADATPWRDPRHDPDPQSLEIRIPDAGFDWRVRALADLSLKQADSLWASLDAAFSAAAEAEFHERRVASAFCALLPPTFASGLSLSFPTRVDSIPHPHPNPSARALAGLAPTGISTALAMGTHQSLADLQRFADCASFAPEDLEDRLHRLLTKPAEERSDAADAFLLERAAEVLDHAESIPHTLFPILLQLVDRKGAESLAAASRDLMVDGRSPIPLDQIQALLVVPTGTRGRELRIRWTRDVYATAVQRHTRSAARAGRLALQALANGSTVEWDDIGWRGCRELAEVALSTRDRTLLDRLAGVAASTPGRIEAETRWFAQLAPHSDLAAAVVATDALKKRIEGLETPSGSPPEVLAGRRELARVLADLPRRIRGSSRSWQQLLARSGWSLALVLAAFAVGYLLAARTLG